MPAIVGIIQARMGSERFPGKMVESLGHYSLIDWVIRRSQKSNLMQRLVLATSTKAENDCLVERANQYSIKSYRGSEYNVLSRFIDISEFEKADVLIRICADNPLISGEEIDRIIRFFIDNKLEYAFNHIPAMGNNYLDGAGAEVLSIETLLKIYANAKYESHLEHVTKYIWDNKNQFVMRTINAPDALAYPHISLDIDTKKDLIWLNQVLSRIKNWQKPEDVNIQDVIKVIQNN